jgi:hypothetical protein
VEVFSFEEDNVMDDQKNVEQESNPKNRTAIGTAALAGIISFVVGSIFGIVGTYMKVVEKSAKLEDQVQILSARLEAMPSNATGSSVTVGVNANANGKPIDPNVAMPAMIQSLQRKFVKESWGEGERENFTAENRKRFIESGQLEAIVEQLKRNNDFVDLVLAVKRLPPSDRQRLLESCRRPLHQTWAQLGRISKDGQTEAGQDTELMIANGVVDAIKGLSLRSDNEIRKLYS